MLIREFVSNAFVVAYREDTCVLESALLEEGLCVVVSRATYTESQLGFSQSLRVLISHLLVWDRIAASDNAAIVVEADFVPCRGLAGFEVPFPPDSSATALGWLYTCGAELYDLVGGRYLRCHSASTVALLVTPAVARQLASIGREILASSATNTYSAWDTEIRYRLQSFGICSFMTLRNYGEHGGFANPEHAAAGLHPVHRADVLAGPLHFLPAYARGNMLTFVIARLRAKARGLGRLLFGRFLRWRDVVRQGSFRSGLAMIFLAVFRLLALR